MISDYPKVNAEYQLMADKEIIRQRDPIDKRYMF